MVRQSSPCGRAQNLCLQSCSSRERLTIGIRHPIPNALAEFYNRRRGFETIPKCSITKIPSAELKPDQYDPFDYSVVSPLVDEIIENRRSVKELAGLGYDPSLAEEILSRVRSAEYKRRQAAPSIKITRKAFGIGWRMPIVNRSREEQL